MPVIGFLSGRSFDDSMEMMTALGQGLNEQGFAEHQNLKIEYRWADGHYDQTPGARSRFSSQASRGDPRGR